MRLLDRYSILDRIGSGGMATIYRATDDRLDRVVCIKLLRTILVEGSGSTNTSGRAVYEATYSHFLQEALALSKLQHPNTLRIYDFGYLDDQSPDPGAPFHVSEYLDGGNLETHVRLRGPIPDGEVVGILEGISSAIAEAHEHNIIHRDIKPSNILFARVRDELVPKLADFGIAHSDLRKQDRSSQDQNQSVSTVALFSPRWAAPEQLCGSPEGPRTDVYALALVTAYMLTGRVLFSDDDVRDTFNDRVRGDTLVNARLGMVGMTGEVGDVLARALLARPEDRIATAPEFFALLRDSLKVRRPTSIVPFPLTPRSDRGSSADLASPAQPGPLPLPPLAPAQSTLALALALDVEVPGIGPGAGVRPADERVAQYGRRRVRFAAVHERLDLSFVDAKGGQVRLRVTMLPASPPATGRLNVKGLNCFVGRRGQRPSPAMTAGQDGSLDLVSVAREVLGELTWSFGQESPTGQGRLFVVDGQQLLVPYSEAREAVALILSHTDDLVVMCRK